ncbi:MAG: hypothetical protein Q8R02_17380 [Hyphomonadaceae bacterium]|nr:hypothetical protein [Hyphomonadaceae bacterium]
MARKPTARVEYIYFDVTYEDGSQRSNRKVPADLLDSHEKDKAILEALAEQDRAISERSGMPPLAIKSIKRSGK